MFTSYAGTNTWAASTITKRHEDTVFNNSVSCERMLREWIKGQQISLQDG